MSEAFDSIVFLTDWLIIVDLSPNGVRAGELKQLIDICNNFSARESELINLLNLPFIKVVIAAMFYQSN